MILNMKNILLVIKKKVHNLQRKTTINYLMIAIMIVFITSVLFIGKSFCFPGTSGDELGYLYHAYKYAGLDFKELMTNSAYYGNGMGLIWYPIIRLCNFKIEAIYLALMLSNAIFVLGGYCISNWVMQQLYPKWESKMRIICCGVVLFIPYTYFYIFMAASPESILYFLYWCLIATIYKLIDSNKVCYTILLCMLSLFMIFVHLRTLGILIMTLVFLMSLVILKKISFKHLAIYFTAVVATVLLWNIHLEYYHNHIGYINTEVMVNTEVNILRRLSIIISDLLSSVVGMSGTIFAYLVGGGIALYLGVLYIGKDVFSLIKNWTKKEMKTNSLISAYVFLVSIGNIFAFYGMGVTVFNRLDQVVYTRYTDNIVSVLILMGMYYLSTNDKWYKNIYTYLLFIILTMTVTIKSLQGVTGQVFAEDSSPAIGGFFALNFEPNLFYFSIIKALIVAIMSCLILYYLQLIKMKLNSSKHLGYVAKYAIIITVGLTSLYMSVGSIDKRYDNSLEIYTSYKNLGNYIEELGAEDIIYINNGNTYNIEMRYLKLLIWDEEINIIEIENLDETHTEGMVILAHPSVEIKDLENIYTGNLKVYQ